MRAVPAEVPPAAHRGGGPAAPSAALHSYFQVCFDHPNQPTVERLLTMLAARRGMPSGASGHAEQQARKQLTGGLHRLAYAHPCRSLDA